MDKFYFCILKITGVPNQPNEPYMRQQFRDGLPKTVSRLFLPHVDCEWVDLVNKAHLVHTALLAELGHGQIHS